MNNYLQVNFIISGIFKLISKINMKNTRGKKNKLTLVCCTFNNKSNNHKNIFINLKMFFKKPKS